MDGEPPAIVFVQYTSVLAAMHSEVELIHWDGGSSYDILIMSSLKGRTSYYRLGWAEI
jgi:hypothetical protein